MTAAVAGTTKHSALAPLVDETRLGSSIGQTLTGVAGIVLAIILIMGQLSLATTKGLAEHLHQSVVHVTEGNKVMESVIERAAPSPQLAKMVEEQSQTLQSTRDTMHTTNASMGSLNAASTNMNTVVGQMAGSSGKLATGITHIGADTKKMGTMLGKLPPQTTKTQTAMSRINKDTLALNTELAAIAGKMQGYGLPTVKGAPRT
jgi:methyl-accepting chemotaxis protein